MSELTEEQREKILQTRRSNRWVRQAIVLWSGRELDDMRLTVKLTSPPFPSNFEQLRLIVNDHFSDKDPAYKRIQPQDWKVTSETSIGQLRDRCHANR